MGKSGKSGKKDKNFDKVRSYYRNLATDDCRDVMDKAKENFIKNYITFKKTHKTSLTDSDKELFDGFIVNVNGFYRSLMKNLRAEYSEFVEIKNVKHERQWHVMMATLKNAHKQNKTWKETAVLYDMSQMS